MTDQKQHFFVHSRFCRVLKQSSSCIISSLFDNKIPSIPQKMVKGLENLEEL